MSEKSLMKLAADLGVSFSVAKIISDHAREEYDAKITKADVLCEAAKEYLAGGEEFQGNDLGKAIADYEGGQ